MLVYSSKYVPDMHSCLSVTCDPPQYVSPASSVCTLLNVLEGKKFISHFETFTSLNIPLPHISVGLLCLYDVETTYE